MYDFFFYNFGGLIKNKKQFI